MWLELDLHLPIESMSTTEGKADLFAVLEDSTEVTLQSSYDTDSTEVTLQSSYDTDCTEVTLQSSYDTDSTEVTLQSSYDTDSTDSRIAQLMQRRHEASVVQNEQTERMAAIIGDNVAVPIPAVDRGRGDA